MGSRVIQHLNTSVLPVYTFGLLPSTSPDEMSLPLRSPPYFRKGLWPISVTTALRACCNPQC